MKKWINYPRVEGQSSRQAHCDLPEGTYERESGREGFLGPVTHTHHTHMPTAWINIDGPLRPQAFDLNKLDNQGASPWMASLFLSNAATKLRLWRCRDNMDHLVRNSDGDDLLFFHQGSGDFFCDYGHLTYSEGDYIVIPRDTLWRIEIKEPVMALLIEATNDAYGLPEKGLLGPQAIFDPAILQVPELDNSFIAQYSEDEWNVVVKKRNQLSTITFSFNPLDTVGWHGELSPVRLNWRDIRPVMSHRYHLPPSAHTTFVATRFVVCTFCPRPMESDPGALKVPFFHNNSDYDEVLFYHKGNFFSRDNIEAGMVTFHPSGFTHGPHPNAFATGEKHARRETDEVAVMLDARDALEVADLPKGVEVKDYVNSWKVES